MCIVKGVSELLSVVEYITVSVDLVALQIALLFLK